MIAQHAPGVPTVPTPPEPVGTGQPVDIVNCSDQSDRSDQINKVGGWKKKSLSGLVHRLRQDREQFSTFKTRHVHTPLSEPSLSHTPPLLEVGTVGAVGTVNKTGDFCAGHRSEQGSEQSEHPSLVVAEPVGELTAQLREEIDASPVQPEATPSAPDAATAMTDADWAALEASFRPAADAVDAWGLTEQERAEGLARMRPTDTGSGVNSDNVTNDTDPIAWGVPQSIPHDVMMAGLLAASRIRPAKSSQLENSSSTIDPWSVGVADLARMTPLDGFTSMQWGLIGQDAAELLRTHGTDMRRLGWNAADAFGIHPDALGRAVRAWGLALLLDGGRVMDVTENGAKIERANGVRQSFTRRSGSGAVPIWEIGR